MAYKPSHRIATFKSCELGLLEENVNAFLLRIEKETHERASVIDIQYHQTWAYVTEHDFGMEYSAMIHYQCNPETLKKLGA